MPYPFTRDAPATGAIAHWRDGAMATVRWATAQKKRDQDDRADKVWRSFSEEKAARESSDCSIAKPARPIVNQSDNHVLWPPK
ncbi:hypothetical protein KQH60_03145 [Mycetohabitans sp. B8]|uniref:hypothetical protein n=1 Tax=Mycetohabitans sp. B8 TaxID=2841845 RepID=UPI001F395406|nr:hypothetical protein [Mycetohabitans sp. B8]MCG1041622.1 hypothetical protein [Mycetohabitans sp. B8]